LVVVVVVVGMIMPALPQHQADRAVVETDNMVVLLVLWDKATTEPVVQGHGTWAAEAVPERQDLIARVTVVPALAMIF
jgi:hypothetical protein